MDRIGETEKIAVGIGDIKIAKSPTVIVTYLGSCIAICLYASSQKVGGMLHVMLGSSQRVKKGEGAPFNSAKYADTGLPEIVRQMRQAYPVSKGDLVAKIFGGANVLRDVQHRIGENNETAVRQALRELGIKIAASQTGGDKGYRVEFHLETGKVFCKIFGEETKEY